MSVQNRVDETSVPRTLVRARGFTTIELVAVMLMVAALAVFAIPRMSTMGFERYTFRHELLSALRYAQKVAMGSGCAIAVELDAAADGYRVLLRSGGAATACGPSANAWSDALQHPADAGPYEGAAGAGVDLQTGDPANPIVFDGFGNHASGPTLIVLANGPPIRVDGVTGYVRD